MAVESEVAAPPAFSVQDGRIARLRRRYQTGPAFLSVDRARYYTESWRDTEGKGIALPVRVAQAMKHVYAHMRHYVDPDDRIAGYWTEYFLGMPIDVERGVFNSVLESELTRGSLVRFRAKSAARGVGYMLRKGGLGDFVRNQRIARASGMPPLNMSLKTMAEREINPYEIAPADRTLLLRDLLPFWKGRTLVDELERVMMESGLYSKDMRDFVSAIPGNTSRQVIMVGAAATIATFQGHLILDYGPVLEKGLRAMHAEVCEAQARAEGAERDFLESAAIALEGVQIYATRLADAVERARDAAVEPGARAVLDRMLLTCRHAPLHPARDFREALQALWTVKTAVELAHPVNLHCFGRLDQILYPYFAKDVEEGHLAPDEARELLEELLLKVMSQNMRPESNMLANFYHRYLGSTPVTLGGVTCDGADATNALTYLFIEAAHQSKAITNVSLRVHPGTPDRLLATVAAFLRQGTASFSLFNDETNIAAMRRRGFSESDARDYAVMGCVETTCPGKTGSMSANALLLCKLLDMTLRNGDVRTITGLLRKEGPETGTPDTFGCFEDLVEAFLAQGKHAIKKIVAASNLRDRLFAERLPAPCISVFTDGCIESRQDVTQGGARYDLAGISMINSIANLVDSLHVIRTLVFEEKRFTLRELIAGMDANFIGFEDMYGAIKRVPGKWGNGDPATDDLARRVMKALFDETYEYASFKGGPFVVYVISMITHTIDGRLSIATADGRKAARPYAASCNPYNVERAGVTAALRSVAALPFEDVMGCAVNMKFHPSAVGDDEATRAKWVALVRAYFRIGGAQLQPTVADAAMLRAAQKEPDHYRDLIVKVGGYSTYFVDMGREIQEEIIARTEHA